MKSRFIRILQRRISAADLIKFLSFVACSYLVLLWQSERSKNLESEEMVGLLIGFIISEHEDGSGDMRDDAVTDIVKKVALFYTDRDDCGVQGKEFVIGLERMIPGMVIDLIRENDIYTFIERVKKRNLGYRQIRDLRLNFRDTSLVYDSETMTRVFRELRKEKQDSRLKGRPTSEE